MRFTYAESMIAPEQYFPLAIEAEQVGFHAMSVADSICYPKHSDSKYPYTSDGDREFLDSKPFIEAFVLAPALLAVTQTLRVHTFVVKLPMRHPVLVAKQMTSIAALSGNRFGFGVGLSPWPDDYRILGVPWKGRGKRLDEQIEIIRGLAGGDYYEFHGEFFDVEPIKIAPAPTEPVPILIGGHSDAALRRAARVGDGWMHGGGGLAHDLDGALARLFELRREYGRDKGRFEIHVISMDAYSVDGIKRLEDRGITDVLVGFRNAYEKDTTTLQQKIDSLRGYADAVISKL